MDKYAIIYAGFDIPLITSFPTIKEKIMAALDKFIEWLRGLKNKIVNFFKGGAMSAKQVEANFKGTKSANESTLLEAEVSEDKIKETNEKIYKYLENNSPIYCFRSHYIPGDEDFDELQKSFTEGLNDDLDSVEHYFSRRLNKYDGDLDKYFKDKLDIYGPNIISANADYVKSGYNYFMSDFTTIDKYIEHSTKLIDKIGKSLSTAKNNLNSIKDEDSNKFKLYKDYIKELGAMQKIINKYIAEMMKTRKVIIISAIYL